jgi:hypothetical protein
MAKKAKVTELKGKPNKRPSSAEVQADVHDYKTTRHLAKLLSPWRGSPDEAQARRRGK